MNRVSITCSFHNCRALENRNAEEGGKVGKGGGSGGGGEGESEGGGNSGGGCEVGGEAGDGVAMRFKFRVLKSFIALVSYIHL